MLSLISNPLTLQDICADFQGVAQQEGKCGAAGWQAARRQEGARPDLHVGVCGETGGDAKSIEFYHKVGLDYVSCSPFRVPVARLAAAQANIKNPRK